MSKACIAEEIAYTRYSDDITLSTNHESKLFDWPTTTATMLKSLETPKLTLNEKKTVFSSKKFNRHVTGITITNDEKASIGRSRKRSIKTRVYLATEENVKQLEELKGIIAFAMSIEPNFAKGLWVKYPKQMKIIMSVQNRNNQN